MLSLRKHKNLNLKSMEAKEFFNNRATSYHRVSAWATDEVLNTMSDRILSSCEGEIGLDLGAGTGALIERLKNYPKRIALDLSDKMLSEIKDVNVEKVVGDVHNLSFPDNYADLIICRQLLHYCDLQLAFSNIKRVVKRNGFLHIVQVIDYKDVPEEWDQEWASFRKVNNRKHLRRAQIEKYIDLHSFQVVCFETVDLRNNYTWHDFFEKHNVTGEQADKVVNFFKNAPTKVKSAINLTLDEEGIQYNRLFGFWLLENI